MNSYRETPSGRHRNLSLSSITALLLLLVSSRGSSACAQGNLNYLYNFPQSRGAVGSVLEVPVRLNFPNGEPLSSWCMNVCHNNEMVQLVDLAPGDIVETLNAGAPVAFRTTNLVPGSGWSVDVVVDFAGANVLLPGNGVVLECPTYTLLQAGSTELNFCNSIGPCATELTLADGTLVVPMTYPGPIEILTGAPEFIFSIPNLVLPHLPNVSDLSFVIEPTVQQNFSIAPDPIPTNAFTLGIEHVELVFDLVSVEPAGPLAALDGGPDFFGLALNPLGQPGFTLGVLYDLNAIETITFEQPSPILSIEYAVDPNYLTTDSSRIINLWWNGDLGLPPVGTTIASGTSPFAPQLQHGSVEFVAITSDPYVRGDCNRTGSVEFLDAFALLGYLFVNPSIPPCVASCDANGDGSLSTSDVVYLANFVFLGGASPSAPFPGCGVGMLLQCDNNPTCLP